MLLEMAWMMEQRNTLSLPLSEVPPAGERKSVELASKPWQLERRFRVASSIARLTCYLGKPGYSLDILIIL